MNRAEKKEIARALKFNSTGFINQGNEVLRVVTDGWSLADAVEQIERFTEHLLRSKQTLFPIKSARGRFQYVSTEPLGVWLIGCLKSVVDIRNNYPFHEFNPLVDLFFRHVERRALLDVAWRCNLSSGSDQFQWADVMNACVQDIRSEGTSAAFKRRLDNYRRASRKNYRSLMTYLNALFALHSRLLVLRVDLSYRKPLQWPAVQLSVTYAQAREQLEAFIRMMKKDLPKGAYAGHAWKFEYGLDKSFHTHMLVVLNGRIVREDVTIARLLGEKWQGPITEGTGLYHNCNADKAGYPRLGIGMIHRDDSALREGLKAAAVYLTKTDFYVRMVAPDGGRSFGRGVLPKGKAGRSLHKGTLLNRAKDKADFDEDNDDVIL